MKIQYTTFLPIIPSTLETLKTQGDFYEKDNLYCINRRASDSLRLHQAPVEVKPIHITIDVNIRVDRALDDFFSDIDEKAQEIK